MKHFVLTSFFIPLFCLSAVDTPSGPLTPEKELATFQIEKGFRIELVAHEPAVVDPVAMAFDAKGRIYLAEMRGYPNGGVGTGNEDRGRIKLLIDENNDGVYEKAILFADKLRFPTSVMPWKDGLLVANAPDLIFMKDSDGDGKADEQRVLYTGFGIDNIQQLLNGLQWGLDNWVYAMVGGNGGTIRSPEKPEMKPVTLRGRGIRFHPEIPGSLEAISGGGQFGLTCDDGQHWFTATNSQHLRQIILPDPYLSRNPFLTVPATTYDIPEHGAACKVFRISPFEAWRVERTSRRKESSDSKRFPTTELVPGGYITSACSPLIYGADLFPEGYRGNNFVCDPANNLIHRERLVPKGSIFSAQRIEEGKEFLASTDNWFRPVALTLGPDGAIYVLDFYREIIETPLSLPEDIKKRWNLESRERGRIWRIVPQHHIHKPLIPFHQESSANLVNHLTKPNRTVRLMAQQLLMEKSDKTSFPLLVELARHAKEPLGQIHALWLLHGQKELKEDHVLSALQSESTLVREQAVRLAESFLAQSHLLRKQVLGMIDDPAALVRFQLAFTLGEINDPQVGTALAKLLQQVPDDTWMESAVLSSAHRYGVNLFEAWLQREGRKNKQESFLKRLVRMIALKGEKKDLQQLLQHLPNWKSQPNYQLALFEGVGESLQQQGQSFASWLEVHGKDMPDVQKAIHAFLETAGQIVRDPNKSIKQRLAAIRLLSYGPSTQWIEQLKPLLVPQTPNDLQLAILQTFAQSKEPSVSEIVLACWPQFTPDQRRASLEVLFAQPDRLKKLLAALEAQKILPSELGFDRIQFLKNHADPSIRSRSQKLLTGLVTEDRQKVIEAYQTILEQKGDASKGKWIFQKNCIACHRLENQGAEVGANLLAALKNKTKSALLIDILDPSREVDTRYLNYQVITPSGRLITGILAIETPTSVTLRRGDNQEDTILRTQIEEIQASKKSLMPEEFEKQITKTEMNDLLEYLLQQNR